MSTETEQFINTQEAAHGKIAFISAGSSLKSVLLLKGRQTSIPLCTNHGMGHCSGQAIVEQAGGSVLRADTGRPLIYNKENLLNPALLHAAKRSDVAAG